MATEKKAVRASKHAKAIDGDSPKSRRLATPSPPKQWKPSKNQSHLRNRARKRERFAATAIYDQVHERKREYRAVFGELAPDPDALLKQLDEAIVLERERRLATDWLAYLEELSQTAWSDATATIRRLGIVYSLVEKLRGKPVGFDSVALFKEARSNASKKGGATKKAKRGAR